MEGLDPSQQAALKKDSTERIQARLVRAGYDEDQVFAMERPALLDLMAEQMLLPLGAVGGDPGTAARGEAHAADIDLREREFALREAELHEQVAARQQQAAQQQQQAAHQAAELELRRVEIRLQEQRLAEDNEWRRAEARRLQTRDEQQAEREDSLPALTKKYGDIMKHVLPHMPTDPAELLNFWDTCGNLWAVYEVPVNLRAKLLLPLLSPKAKSLVSRLSARQLADVDAIKEFLLREFKLTHREYRARFNAATRAPEETHTLFVSRLKNLFSFYMRSRECDSLDKLVDLVVADRLKDTLSGPCLKYCLSIEGQKTLSASELASLADVFDVNYTPDGRYRGGTVTNFKDTSSVTQVASRPNLSTGHPLPEIPRMGGFPQNRPSARPGQGQQHTQVQRKCWICSSASHMRSACPKGNRTNSANSSGRPPVQSACTTVGHTNESSPLLNTDHENSVSNVQVNRCVVESCDDRVTDVCDGCSPVMLNLDKTNEPLTVNNISKSEYEVNHICNTEPSQAQDKSKSVQTSPLTYIQVMVGDSGPYRCMSDSGTEFPIAKESVMSNIVPLPQKHGQIKLQGIFGEPVVADLVDLPVSLFDTNAENQASNPVSLLFTVTSAIVQDCDLIIPAQVVSTLQNSSTCEGKPDSVEVNMITRGQAKARKQSESNSEEPQSNQYSNPYKVEQQLSSI